MDDEGKAEDGSRCELTDWSILWKASLSLCDEIGVLVVCTDGVAGAWSRRSRWWEGWRQWRRKDLCELIDQRMWR